MFKNLSPGAIGIRGLSLEQSIDLAAQTGFAGIAFSLQEADALAQAHGSEYVADLFSGAGILPGHWNLPVNWKDDNAWEADLAELPRLATLANKLGCLRTSTWCPSFSDVRDYDENWDWHVERFRAIARVLKEHGCSLGIEFIGPKTSRIQGKYPFIYTMGEMMDLAADIGTGNVGLLLDAWHLYTSGGTADDLDELEADDVVVVHVNDAPQGVERDDQIDRVRMLPMETGVIDLPAFMAKLKAMRYEGPITPEPLGSRITAISDPMEAAKLAAEYMDKLWQASDLA